MFAARKTDGAATAAAATYIEDVFSTYLYTGTGAAQSINNGIALGSAYGGSVFFDGTGDNLKNTSAGTAFQTGTGNFTIEFWFRGGAQNPYAVIFELYVNGGAQQRLAIQDGGSGNSAIYVEGGNIRITTSTNPWDNVWHHHAIVRNGSIVTYYIDGVSNGTFTTAINVTTGDSFILGEYSGSGFALNGNLSNFRFVKGTAVYTSAFTPPTTPLTAITNTSLLICQSPSPTTDYSSNAFPITVTNAIAQNGGGPFTDSTANKGGMVWLKSRSAATDHALYDTNRGATFDIGSNLSTAQTTQTTGLTSFNSNGFSIGSLAKLNTNAATYASWTFRKQAKFFDVVTYTGNGSNRTIAHNLGSVPGCIIVKRTDSTGNWRVYHRGLTSAAYSVLLNLTNAESTATSVWNSTAPTSTEFSVGTATDVNASGGSYVAYLFAHDAGGFGPTGSDNVITCGTYLGSNHRAREVVQLGYEPQFVMIKNITTVQQWVMVDNMRGMAQTGSQAWLAPNTSAAETTTATDNVVAASTGFFFNGAQAPLNQAGSTFIYIAIRRGPMKTPTSGTSVFSPTIVASIGATSAAGPSPTDLSILKPALTTVNSWRVVDRLRGNDLILSTDTTSAESTETYYKFDTQSGLRLTSWPVANSIFYNLKRAPGFFDEVCYTGAGNNTTVSHNLGVVPELAIFKSRNTGGPDWVVRYPGTTTDRYMLLNTTGAEAVASGWYSATSSQISFPTSYLGTANSGYTYVAYLFASCPGVSKVGSFTNTGSTINVECGFTNGARFILLKRTNTTGGWFVYDTARGINPGTDPGLALNSTAAEYQITDDIDAYAGGFTFNGANWTLADYIYLAIA